MGLITVVAGPVGFSDVTFSGGFDVVDALKPDQRNRVRVSVWPSSRLELEPALHEFGPRSPSQEQVEQAEIDQQRREHFRLLVGVHLLHRPLSMLEGAGRFAGDADQDQPRRDPGAERRVARCRAERLFEIRGCEPDRTVVPPDLREQLKALCLHRGRQVAGGRTLGEQPRAGDVAGLEQRRTHDRASAARAPHRSRPA